MFGNEDYGEANPLCIFGTFEKTGQKSLFLIEESTINATINICNTDI